MLCAASYVKKLGTESGALIDEAPFCSAYLVQYFNKYFKEHRNRVLLIRLGWMQNDVRVNEAS